MGNNVFMTNQIVLRVLLIFFLFSSCSMVQNKSYFKQNFNETCFEFNEFKKNYKGMTKEQIIYIFGNPIISDSFNDAFHYIIYEKEKDIGCYKKTLNIFFRNNKVSKFNIQ